MKLSTQNKTTKNKGIIKSKPLVDILVEKTEKKKKKSVKLKDNKKFN